MKFLIVSIIFAAAIAQAETRSSHPVHDVVVLENNYNLIQFSDKTDAESPVIGDFNFTIPGNNPFFQNTSKNQTKETSFSHKNTKSDRFSPISSKHKSDNTNAMCTALVWVNESITALPVEHTTAPESGSLVLLSFCSGSLIFLRRIFMI